MKTQSKIIYRFLLIPLAIIGFIQLFTFSFSTEKENQSFQQKMKESYNIYSFSPPNSLSFAEEMIPLGEPEVNERLDRELLANTYFHSNTILYFKRANREFPIIEPILKEEGIPDDFKYLALIESGLQNVVSPAGATGYWQFLKSTGKEYGLEISSEVDERYHIEKATRAACKYLKDAYELYGSWALVAASYNAGMNRISSELERQKTNNYYDLLLNQETGRYVFRIVAVKQILTHPEQYGFNIRKSDLYEPLNFKLVSVDSSISNFADFATENMVSYKILKHFNPWLREAYLKNPQRLNYQIKIPTDLNYQLKEG